MVSVSSFDLARRTFALSSISPARSIGKIFWFENWILNCIFVRSSTSALRTPRSRSFLATSQRGPRAFDTGIKICWWGGWVGSSLVVSIKISVKHSHRWNPTVDHDGRCSSQSSVLMKIKSVLEAEVWIVEEFLLYQGCFHLDIQFWSMALLAAAS